jgi:glutamate---cysteine ligase / carboxylate-amine ligase
MPAPPWPSSATGMAETVAMRTVGVEEELLLVDAETGVPVAVADAVLRLDPDRRRRADAAPGGTVDVELQQQQIETDTTPCSDLTDLGNQVREARHRADQLARRRGARVAALGTSPLPSSPEVTAKPRYLAMIEQYGLVTLDQLTCGCHIHVSVDSADEGVGVLDRIRVWLPTLLALSANSPFWQGRDSGYASYRSQAWNRFPTAGPNDVFGSAVGYTALVDGLLRSGVALDSGMIYFDARLSAHYPTVEIRIADICLDAEDAILIAALTRALVDAAARDWAAGRPPPVMATTLLRAATWRAARSALSGDLLDPFSGLPRPAAEVVASLVAHVAPALDATGDRAQVDQTLSRLLARGPGATRQHELFARSADLHRLVLDAADLTLR